MTLTSSLRDRVAGPVIAPSAAGSCAAKRRTATPAEHQPATVVARSIERPPARVTVSGG